MSWATIAAPYQGRWNLGETGRCGNLHSIAERLTLSWLWCNYLQGDRGIGCPGWSSFRLKCVVAPCMQQNWHKHCLSEMSLLELFAMRPVQSSWPAEWEKVCLLIWRVLGRCCWVFPRKRLPNTEFAKSCQSGPRKFTNSDFVGIGPDRMSSELEVKITPASRSHCLQKAIADTRSFMASFQL